MRSYDSWRRLLADQPLPTALIDLDALDANQDTMLGLLANAHTMRIASKSLRVPALLRYLLARGGDRMRGLMTFSAHETAFLAEQGFDDLLLAYPICRRDEAAALAAAAEQAEIRCVVDHIDQATLLSAAAEDAGTTLKLCVDVDGSLRPRAGGGRAHFGVRRSPIRSGPEAVRLAEACAGLPGVNLDSVMLYEAQVAGVSDERVPGLAQRLVSQAKQAVKARSIPLAARRRSEVVHALQLAGFNVTLVNGGGTGSLHSTSADLTVTEVTAGSGFFCPHLFDHYDRLPLRPALFFALGVVRSSDHTHITCAGGGYVASGAPGEDRLPKAHEPQGLRSVGLEGYGEVQTPFDRSRCATRINIGDPIICRPAKAGELAERFHYYALIRDDRVIDRVTTYRGAGATFY